MLFTPFASRSIFVCVRRFRQYMRNDVYEWRRNRYVDCNVLVYCCISIECVCENAARRMNKFDVDTIDVLVFQLRAFVLANACVNMIMKQLDMNKLHSERKTCVCACLSSKSVDVVVITESVLFLLRQTKINRWHWTFLASLFLCPIWINRNRNDFHVFSGDAMAWE